MHQLARHSQGTANSSVGPFPQLKWLLACIKTIFNIETEIKIFFLIKQACFVFGSHSKWQSGGSIIVKANPIETPCSQGRFEDLPNAPTRLSLAGHCEFIGRTVPTAQMVIGMYKNDI